jgi:exopolysaccharide biosynthesis polyprenyl glycosylphosphotransferase
MTADPGAESTLQAIMVGTSATIDGEGCGSSADESPEGGIVSGKERIAPSEVPPWDSPRWTYWLIFSDFFVSILSIALGLFLLSLVTFSSLNNLEHFSENFKRSALFPVMVIIGMGAVGSYRSSQRSPNQSTFTMLKDYLLGISLGGVASMTLSKVAFHAFGISAVSSVQQVAIVLVAFALVPMSRALVRRHALKKRPVRVLIVDSGLRKDRIATHVAIQHGFDLVGWIVAKGPVPEEAIGTIDQLPEIVDLLAIDRVIIGSTERIGAETLDIFRRVLPFARVSIVPRSFELISWRSRLTDLSGLPLLEVAPPLMTSWDRFVKRTFDICFASTALILTLPISLVIGILVKATSKGPVFFRQSRLGKGRREFTIMKFRTMREVVEGSDDVGTDMDHEDETPLHVLRNKSADDMRITPIGRFLRKAGLDEIPQFLNVIGGSMSIVGPRPFITSESEPPAGWSARRFEVRPGITGLWQVSGRNDLSGDDLRQLDYLYVASWSMLWDLRIVLETPQTMIRGLGAY